MSNREEELEEALEAIKQWCDAYPRHIFRDVTVEEINQMAKLLQDNDMRIDALHAHWARHLLDGIGKIATQALSVSVPHNQPKGD